MSLINLKKKLFIQMHKNYPCHLFQQNVSNVTDAPSHSRDCIDTSPALLLLANLVPVLFLQLILPSIPFFVKYVRISITSADQPFNLIDSGSFQCEYADFVSSVTSIISCCRTGTISMASHCGDHTDGNQQYSGRHHGDGIFD